MRLFIPIQPIQCYNKEMIYIVAFFQKTNEKKAHYEKLLSSNFNLGLGIL